MRLPKCRWFYVLNGKTYFRFGKYKDEALEDTMVKPHRGVSYLEWMLDMEDMTPEVAAFINEALRIGGDPISGTPGGPATSVPEPPQSHGPTDPLLERLKEKAAQKSLKLKQAEKTKETENLLKKRKREAPW